MSKNPKKNTFPHEVDWPLQDDEALEYNDKAQSIDEQADTIETEIKDAAKEQKLEVKKLRAQAKQLRVAAKERKERRSVSCYSEVRGSQVVYISLDTGAIVDQRGATPEDMQENFPGLAKAEDDLPLEPDYTPSPDAPQGEFEKPRKKKAKGKRGDK